MTRNGSLNAVRFDVVVRMQRKRTGLTMNTIDFCYWLQGYFEVSGAEKIDEKQTQIIKNHLNLVFTHEIDPLRESETTATAGKLNAVHSGKAPYTKNDLQKRC